MITSTNVLVLRIVPYSDSKVILNAYSPDFGRISFLHFKPKATKKGRAGYFHPLALLEVLFNNHEKKQVHTARSVQHAVQLQSVLSNPAKQSITLFLAEFFNLILKDEDANPHLYHYLAAMVEKLDADTNGYPWYHLKVVLEVAAFTGFFPELQLRHNHGKAFLNLYTGELEGVSGPFSASEETTGALRSLLELPYEDLVQMPGGKGVRAQVLNDLMRFYALHFPDFKEPASLKIFRDY